MTDFRETPAQTAGPYVHIGLTPWAAGFTAFEHELGRDIAGPNAAGERITITGRVLDGDSAPMTDVLIEVWQANAAGHYPGTGDVEEGFQGWGRVVPDFETGVFSFDTIKPGPVGQMAPHITLWLVARGINLGLHTRLYFADEDAANAHDPVLAQVTDPGRRKTLMAQPDGANYRFDIIVQGENETVFFDV